MIKILIIEDDELIRENMNELFSNEGYQVEVANDGKIGLKKIREIIPDLIVSDIMMPELDGFQVYKSIRDDPNLSIIPFIFLSALSDRKNHRIGMGLGADDYITKPFANSELLTVVKERIEKSKLRKKAMDDLKFNLIRSVPHEFLTPLNSILGFSQLLIEGTNSNELSTADTKEFAEYINLAGQKLLRLTTNYILLTELTLMSKNPKFTESVLSEITMNIHLSIPEFISNLAKVNNRLEDISVYFESANLKISSKNLMKIVEELLDNAIKFSTPKTKILIRGFHEEQFYCISFQDEGIGIHFDDLKKIESFMQFERDKTEQAGLGLGLSIVMKLVDLNQGQFRIESKRGHGTIVTVKFWYEEKI